MKHIYFLIILLFSSSVFSQNDLLGTWYFHSYSINGSEEVNIYNEDFNIIFNDLGGFDGSAVCNGYAGTYTIVDSSTIDIYLDSWTLVECSPPESYFYENGYENILVGTDPISNIFTYEIVGAGNDSELFLTNGDGSILSYGRQQSPYFTLSGVWYVHHIIWEGAQFDNVYDGVYGPGQLQTYFSFTDGFIAGFELNGSTVCNFYGGDYTVQNNNIRVHDIAVTLVGCEDPFEHYYQDVITNSGTNPTPYNLDYEIIGIGDEETLIITNTVGNQIHYGRQALPTFNLFGNWKLQYMNIDGTQINNTDAFGLLEFKRVQIGSYAYEFNGDAICNGYAGDFSVVGDTVILNSFNTTLMDCGDPLEDSYFYNVLDTSTDEIPTSLRYVNALDGDEEGLLITNESNGNQAYYYKQSLSNEEFERHNLVSIYPNPTSEILNIRGLDIIEVTYTILSINGKTIIEDGIFKNNSIDVSSLTSGLYFLQLKNGISTEIIKFLKN